MVRLILGGVLLFFSAICLIPSPKHTPAESLGAAAFYAVVGLPLVFFGWRARKRRGKGPSTLAQAVRKKQPEVLRRMIEAGADVNHRDGDALHSACTGGHLEAARILIQAGANVNLTQYGRTPLMHAALCGHTDLVELLLQFGADVRPARDDGKTVLFDAADAGTAEMVRLLLQAGADVNAKSKKGHTAIFGACGLLVIGKKPDVAVELIEAGAEMSGTAFPDGLWGLDKAHPYDWVVDLGAKDSLGNTLLMIAAWSGRAHAVKRLLEKVPLDAVNKQNQTALMLAASQGHQEVVLALLEAGAGAAARDGNGRTAAALAAEKGHGDVARLIETFRDPGAMRAQAP